MARKQKNPPRETPKSAADYYKLNLKAVDDLVTADRDNSPKVSEAELRKYRSGPKIRLSESLKALLIKFWFNGATCFFFLWGLGAYLHSWLDQMVVLALALGAVTDLLTNNVFRFYARTPGANDRWMMFPQRAFYTLPLNLLYAGLLLFLVMTTYNVVNAAIIGITGAKDTLPLGVGPILFGVFTTAWDILLIRIKHTAQSVLSDARRATKGV
ncbi:MAG: hypothetical protein IKF98_05895 [Clostridia bacterium]|nr:hypothetical protein [Clostridia bacterium]